MDFVAIKYLGLTIDICTYNYTYMCMNEVRAMVQVTIYLEDEIEKKMTAAAKTAHVSKSTWIASLIKAKVANEWPESITHLAGAWKDLSLAEEGRSNLGRDAEREQR